MKSPIDIVGKVYGRLTVLGFSYTDRHRKSHWVCQCSCGQPTTVCKGELSSGHTSSCGCLHAESTGNRFRKHGCSKRTPEYRSWLHMKGRVLNSLDDDYRHYGGRGITICDEWINSFENFLADMGERPTPKHTLERNNVNGHYEPDNCRWATWKEQQNNRRDTVKITHDGKSLSCSQWDAVLGRKDGITRGRISQGWDSQRAITQPVGTRKRVVAKLESLL